MNERGRGRDLTMVLESKFFLDSRPILFVGYPTRVDGTNPSPKQPFYNLHLFDLIILIWSLLHNITLLWT